MADEQLTVPLVARGLRKEYPGVVALDDVSLTCRAGRVHALVGENGAGKSTLVRILTGNVRPDGGELLVDGQPRRFANPRDAAAAGIGAVYQELTVMGAMSVLDNVLLGQERSRRGFLRGGEQRRVAREALGRVGLGDVRLDQPAERLSLANQQLIEIARALVRDARVLILDEPTAVLAGEQLEATFEVVRSLAAEGVAIVYISHRLEEIHALADDVTVLRDGRDVSAGPAADYDAARLVREMVGRDVDTVFPDPRPARDQVVLRVDGLRRPAHGRDRADRAAGPPVWSGEVRAGEIVALAGMLGSGRSRLLRTLAGVEPAAAGAVTVDDRAVRPRLRSAIAAGMVLVPEERKTDGLVLDLPVRANVTLADLASVAHGGWIAPDREREVYEDERERLGIAASGPDQETRQLSGGNQQKVVLAKWLRTTPRVLLLDEPTRGIDVGAKTEIYALIRRLAEDGMAVVFASSDLTEVVGLAHRILVMRDGVVVEELPRGADAEAIMRTALAVEEVAA